MESELHLYSSGKTISNAFHPTENANRYVFRVIISTEWITSPSISTHLSWVIYIEILRNRQRLQLPGCLKALQFELLLFQTPDWMPIIYYANSLNVIGLHQTPCLCRTQHFYWPLLIWFVFVKHRSKNNNNSEMDYHLIALPFVVLIMLSMNVTATKEVLSTPAICEPGVLEEMPPHIKRVCIALENSNQLSSTLNEYIRSQALGKLMLFSLS